MTAVKMNFAIDSVHRRIDWRRAWCISSRRANLAGDNHMLPAIEKVTVSVSCSFPSSISILADQHVNDLDAILTTIKAESGPGKVRMPPITVANGRTIRVAAVGITDSGKAFANSSSLSLSWELANCNELAFWDDNHIADMSVSSWERFLVLRNESGMCDVRASAVLPSTMNGYSSLPQFRSSDFVLEDAVRLQEKQDLYDDDNDEMHVDNSDENDGC